MKSVSIVHVLSVHTTKQPQAEISWEGNLENPRHHFESTGHSNAHEHSYVVYSNHAALSAGKRRQ